MHIIIFLAGILVGYSIRPETPQIPLSVLGRQADTGYCALVFEGYIKKDLTRAEISYCKKLIETFQKIKKPN